METGQQVSLGQIAVTMAVFGSLIAVFVVHNWWKNRRGK